MSSERTLTLVLVSLIVSATPSLAAEEAASTGMQFSPVGSFFSRYEHRENYADGTDLVRFRSRLGVQTNAFDIGEQTTLRLRFVPQASGFWHVGGDTPGDAALDLHEGFVELGFGDASRVQVGRIEMAYGDQLVIGPVGWHHAGRSFDAARYLWRSSENVGLDVFGSLITEGREEGLSSDELGAGDVWFMGVYGFLGGLVGDGHALEPYLLARVAPRATLAPGPDDNEPATLELTIGARVKGAYEALDWRVEGGAQTGRRPESRDADVLAGQVDGEVGVRLGSARKFRLALNGFFASGDDPDTAEDEGWFQLYPTAHKWMGYMDFIGGRTNVLGGALLASAAFGERWTAYAHVFEFHRPRDGAQASGRVGTEVDAGARYAVGRGVGLRGGYGLFVPDEDVSSELLHFVEFELAVALP